MPDEEFHNRTVLVTGGSRGIGRAICVRLAETGARIAINYSGNEEAAQETLKMVTAAGATGAVFKADVSNLDAMKQMYAEIEDQLGPVDMLVSNAGVARAGDKLDMSFEIWNEMMRVNLDGTFHAIWLAKDGMLARGFGRIVCMASVAGLARNPLAADRLLAYGTSKAAVIGLSRNCAAAFAPNVRVNCIAPGFIETDMTANASEAGRKLLRDATPLARLGKPEEIAEMAYFLLSDRSSYTTGQTVVASGGMVTLP
ncbi:MAG TPA: 3-oxoacyl-ACP reductase family protein [Burkholderiales bacterium]|nr:3-oxoacyl-ACP reductase family protein [Burkholderiales bacterium]